MKRTNSNIKFVLKKMQYIAVMIDAVIEAKIAPNFPD